MNTFFRYAILASLAALAAGCCANNPCNCNDLQADSLYLTLKSTPDPRIPNDTTFFSGAELDTVYLRRYSPATPAALSDPVSLVRARRRSRALITQLQRANLDTTTVVISNNNPFTPSTTGGKLNAYAYLLTVKDGRVGAHAYNFYLTNIQLKGSYDADGCCTCYHNTFKGLQLAGKTTVNKIVTDSLGYPRPILLSKKS